MGNWRSVNIEGTCGEAEVSALIKAVGIDFSDEGWGCLTFTGGLSGLPLWPGKTISACGNLAERDYGPDDVAEALNTYLKIAPSLNVKVHCGGDYEDKKCIATVGLVDGKYTVQPPEVEAIREPAEGQAIQNMMFQLSRQRRF